MPELPAQFEHEPQAWLRVVTNCTPNNDLMAPFLLGSLSDGFMSMRVIERVAFQRSHVNNVEPSLSS